MELRITTENSDRCNECTDSSIKPPTHSHIHPLCNNMGLRGWDYL